MRSPTPQPVSTTAVSPLLVLFALAYFLLIIYGTLYPLSGWQDNHQDGLWLQWPRYFSTSDIITNILVYIPLGFLTATLLKKRLRLGIALVAACVLGTVLSTALEYLQQFLPGRVASIADILLNATGTALGAAAAAYWRAETVVNQRWRAFKALHFKTDTLSALGLGALGLWALSQLMPLVPSLDIASLRQGLSPLAQTLLHPATFKLSQFLAYALNFAALGLVITTLTRERHRALVIFIVLTLSVLLLKVPIVIRQLSLEAVSGWLLALPLFVLLDRSRTAITLLAGLCLILAYTIEALGSGTLQLRQPGTMNWVPFQGQIGTLNGLIDILQTLWPFAALAYLMMLKESRRNTTVALGGGLFVLLYTLAVEWLQQYTVGRYPDITDPLIALSGWSIAWLYYFYKKEHAAKHGG